MFIFSPFHRYLNRLFLKLRLGVAQRKLQEQAQRALNFQKSFKNELFFRRLLYQLQRFMINSFFLVFNKAHRDPEVKVTGVVLYLSLVAAVAASLICFDSDKARSRPDP